MESQTPQRLLFAGLTIAGAALAESLIPGGGLVTAVAGGIGSNFLHQLSDDLAGHLSTTGRPNPDILTNDDLKRLVRTTISASLADLALSPSMPRAVRRRLRLLSGKAEAAWIGFERHAQPKDLNEGAVIRLFAMSETAFRSATAMDPETWADFLKSLETTVTNESALGYLTRDIRSLGSSPLDDAARLLVGRQLTERIPGDLFLAAKSAFGRKDPAYAALQLHLMRELMTEVRDITASARSLGPRQDDLEKRLADIAEAVKSLAPGVLAAAPLGQQPDLQPILDDIDAKHVEQVGYLKRIEPMVRDIHSAMKAGQARFGERATDNLAVAGATRNAAFVGRQDRLDELSRLVNDPDGPNAIAVVAGAGFGKTELVKEFINAWATLPDGWHGRWWIDGSKGGEINSLRSLFRLLLGRELPAEPGPQQGEDETKAMREWVEEQRRTVTQACSTGKHLLVLDNAESATQVDDYRPANAGRLIATTRRQRIPRSVAVVIDLDEMSAPDAKRLLVGRRKDLLAPVHEAGLGAIASHLGNHALALAYAGAALGQPPYQSPSQLLERLQRVEVGEEGDLLHEFTELDLGTRYKLPLARSLSLLLDELADENNGACDPLAMRLVELASFCDPRNIPLEVFRLARSETEDQISQSLRALHERSIITFTDSVAIHRLTQSLVRGRLKGQANNTFNAVLQSLLETLVKIHGWPKTVDEESAVHVRDKLRTTCWPHSERALAFVFPQDGVPSVPAIHLGITGSRLRSELAWHLGQLGQLRAAMGHIDAAIHWGEVQSPRDERGLAIWYASRARIRQDRGDLAGAEGDIARSIDWGEAQSPRDERGLAIWYALRASNRHYRGDLAGAEGDIARSIDWGEAQSPRDERSLAIRYASRARIRQDRGDLAGAEGDIARSIDWGEAQSPRDERSLAIDYTSRASIRKYRGDLAGAEGDIARSIDWGEAQSPRDERSLAIRYALRARIRQDRGDLAGAEGDIARSIDWGEAQSPRDERSLAIRYALRARIRQGRGDLAGAEGDIARSIDWGEAQSPRDERSLAIDYASRARIRQDRGELAGAEVDINRAIQWYEANLPGDERTLSIMRKIRETIDSRR